MKTILVTGQGGAGKTSLSDIMNTFCEGKYKFLDNHGSCYDAIILMFMGRFTEEAIDIYNKYSYMSVPIIIVYRYDGKDPRKWEQDNIGYLNKYIKFDRFIACTFYNPIDDPDAELIFEPRRIESIKSLINVLDSITWDLS